MAWFFFPSNFFTHLAAGTCFAHNPSQPDELQVQISFALHFTFFSPKSLISESPGISAACQDVLESR